MSISRQRLRHGTCVARRTCELQSRVQTCCCISNLCLLHVVEALCRVQNDMYIPGSATHTSSMLRREVAGQHSHSSLQVTIESFIVLLLAGARQRSPSFLCCSSGSPCRLCSCSLKKRAGQRRDPRTSGNVRREIIFEKNGDEREPRALFASRLAMVDGSISVMCWPPARKYVYYCNIHSAEVLYSPYLCC